MPKFAILIKRTTYVIVAWMTPKYSERDGIKTIVAKDVRKQSTESVLGGKKFIFGQNLPEVPPIRK